MLDYRHLLVPTDRSEEAARALEAVVDLARRLGGATIHLLHVGPSGETPGETPGDDFPPLPADAGAPGVTIRPERVEGDDVARALLGYASERGVDLIVMGTHGHRSLTHPALGGVTGEIVRKAPCPVVTIRADDAPERRPGAIRHVLAPVDFSAYAAEGVRHARHLAALYEARLDLLFVAEERMVPLFSDTGLPTITVMRLDDEIVAQAEEALRQLYARTDGPDVEVAYYVHRGHPAHEILAFAEERQVDLIVMSTHGLTAHSRFSLGSITETVVRKATAPVWVLRGV